MVVCVVQLPACSSRLVLVFSYMYNPLRSKLCLALSSVPPPPPP